MPDSPERPDALPVLGYAPRPPRAMSTRTKAALAAGAVGIAVAVGGYVYRARQAQTVVVMGVYAPPQLEWDARDEAADSTADPAYPSPTGGLEIAPPPSGDADAPDVR